MEKKKWVIKIWVMAAAICLGSSWTAYGAQKGMPVRQELKLARGISAGNGFWVDANGMLVAYRGNGGDITIPSSVTRIGEGAFEDCIHLTGIKIPSGVYSIGEGAFENCRNLKSVSIASGLNDIGEGAFEECSSLTSITIPSSVVRIGEGAFENCSSLTKIKIPSGVTNIEDSVFENCYSLSSITIPSGVMSIGEDAFSGCGSLKSVTIPPGVGFIGEEAFFRCGDLTSITIPSSVTRIGENAFTSCGRGFVIYCERNSFAERYAQLYGIDYKYKKGSDKTSQKTQKISAKNITKSYDDDPFFIRAKTNGGGKLTYEVWNEKVATVSRKGEVTIKGCGVTKITIRAAAKNKYASAKKTIKLTVEPKKQKISSLQSKGSTALRVKWRRDSKVTGYMIQYSTNQNFKSKVKTETVDENDITATTITGLKRGKTYYVRMCAYKMSDGKLIQGDYGQKKKVRLK